MHQTPAAPPASDASPSGPPPPSTNQRATARTVFALCCMWSGLVITEAVSNNVLPLTIRTFTEEAWLIGIILAINPAFGFIAQPLVGVLSDRIWTPLGRRAVFIVISAPIVAVCLLLVPAAQILWQLVIIVVAYQFFQDIIWGSDHPLIADLVPPWQRTFVVGLIACVSQLSTFVFLRVGLPNLSVPWLYYTAAIAQVVLVAAAALLLKERRNVSTRPKLTVRRYLMDVLGDRYLRLFAFASFLQMLFSNVVGGFVVLFVVQNLEATRGEFGEIWSLQSMIILVAAIPTGLAVERYLPKHWALCIGFAIGLAACILGTFAADLQAFFIITMIWGFGSVLTSVTFKPFMTEYIPRDIIGQVTGAINIFAALGRTAALLGGGALVSIFGNNYRTVWWIAIVAGTSCVLLCTRLPDLRFRQRKSDACP